MKDHHLRAPNPSAWPSLLPWKQALKKQYLDVRCGQQPGIAECKSGMHNPTKSLLEKPFTPRTTCLKKMKDHHLRAPNPSAWPGKSLYWPGSSAEETIFRRQMQTAARNSRGG
ncbi:hypothetical protein CDAR_16511 [Caerostris darwini]|uniref:Uncharacterized protein n=1 Tax=Caerostris darwini TaxID=1538125 RepID=A0AAV4P5K7_9ARAC|nr:hypothetical protein CDAR_16511 [Caerostris darwini]